MNIISLDDLTLIAQVITDGSDRAFERLVRKYQSPVRRFFLSQSGGDTMLSDDLAQETFIKVYSSISSFRQLSSFKTWLFRIAYNVWLDYLRKRRESSLSPLMEENAIPEWSSGQESPDSMLSLDINTAMGILSDRERTCVSLNVIEDLPVETIVKITELPAGTVKSHLFRGKQKLADYLKKQGYHG